jgi:hypothetical protein
MEDPDDYKRDDRAMMRASLESMGDEYWSDEDDVTPQGSTSSSSMAPASSSSSAAHAEDDDDDLIDESNALEHWNEVAEALADPHGSLRRPHLSLLFSDFFLFRAVKLRRARKPTERNTELQLFVFLDM